MIVLMEQVVRLTKQMFAPAEVSISWMSVAEESMVYQLVAKFFSIRPPVRVSRTHLYKLLH